MNKTIARLCFSVLLLIIGLSGPSTAQELSDEEVYEENDALFQGRERGAIVELSGISSLGNSDTGSFFLGTEIFYKGQGHWVRFDGSTYYSEGNDSIAARVLEGRLELARALDRSNYIIATGILKHDLKQKIDLRSSVGFSYGHRLIKVSFEELTFEVGLGIQNENFSGPESSDYTEGQFGLKYLFKFSDTASFENRTHYLPSLERLRDYRVRSEFKLSDTIHNNVGILVRVIFEFDGSPFDSEVNKLDTRIFGGATYNFLD